LRLIASFHRPAPNVTTTLLVMAGEVILAAGLWVRPMVMQS
jgi:hypothetical protein